MSRTREYRSAFGCRADAPWPPGPKGPGLRKPSAAVRSMINEPATAPGRSMAPAARPTAGGRMSSDMTKMPDDLVSKYQRQLLDQAQQTYDDTPISEATVRAFLATPRHLFVRHYRERASKEWRDVNASHLTEQLGTLYADNPLTLFGDDDDNVASTISQPSFVLRMLDLLQVRPGHAVLELGAGSGWNAALIGRLVGPSGRVVTLEVIPEVADRAAATIAELDITNVHAVSAEGGDEHA